MRVSDPFGSWLLIVGIATSVSLVSFLGIGGLVHYWLYVRRRGDEQSWKLQPKRFLSKANARHAFFLGTGNDARRSSTIARARLGASTQAHEGERRCSIGDRAMRFRADRTSGIVSDRGSATRSLSRLAGNFDDGRLIRLG